MNPLEIEVLTGRHVVLEPLRPDHVGDLAAAAAGDRTSFGYTQVPDGPQQTAAYVDWLLADLAAGNAGPFAQRRVADGRVIGCTRYLHPAWPLGRSHPDEIEVGGTWLAADAQRSAVNTEAKLLLLTDAFERLGVQRVAICTDARNDRSRRAIERLGARFEGVLHRHRRSFHAGDGDRLRVTAVYAVTVDRWPGVRHHLVSLLER
ncbi:MAG TPA: GNAT family protein [Ilumatobacteraceae bacterium]|nr:GNAT family protein [Ilumatobacteraceae bacterium]